MKKTLLIIVLVVIVIILALVAICYTQKDKLVQIGMEKAMQSVESVIVKNLPSSIEEDSAKTIVREFFANTQAQKIPPAALQAVMTQFQTSFADQKLDSAEVTDILSRMKAASHPKAEDAQQ